MNMISSGVFVVVVSVLRCVVDAVRFVGEHLRNQTAVPICVHRIVVTRVSCRGAVNTTTGSCSENTHMTSDS